MNDPPAEIGRGLLEVPNTIGLYWVDSTVRETYEPPE
jgi:hypothetical protein